MSIHVFTYCIYCCLELQVLDFLYIVCFVFARHALPLVTLRLTYYVQATNISLYNLQKKYVRIHAPLLRSYNVIAN